MRVSSLALDLTLVLLCCGPVTVATAQPSLPKGNIPADIHPGVREQLERLHSPNPVDRGYAAQAIGKLGAAASPAVPFLASMLDDTSALEWRAQFFTQGALTSPGELAGEALAALAREGSSFPPGVVEHILSALKDARSAVGAAIALGALKESRAIDPLIVLLSAPEPKSRRVAARALGEIGDRRAVAALIEALKDRDHQIAASAHGALRAITGQDFGVHFADWEVWWSAEGPAWLSARGPGEFDRHVKDLTQGNWVTKVEAAAALGRLRDVRAVQPLLAVLDPAHHPEVRKAAALALISYARDKRAMRALRDLAAGDPNDDVRRTALEALEKIEATKP